MEARDEKQLLRFQKRLAGYKLLIIDELGFVPLVFAAAGTQVHLLGRVCLLPRALPKSLAKASRA